MSHNPEANARFCRIVGEIKRSPEARRKASESSRRTMSNEDVRRRISIGNKITKSDPEFKKRFSKKQMEAHHRRRIEEFGEKYTKVYEDPEYCHEYIDDIIMRIGRHPKPKEVMDDLGVTNSHGGQLLIKNIRSYYPTAFLTKMVSESELEMFEYILSSGFDVKKKLRGFNEIDAYVDSMKIGFEYNGAYWHSSERKDELFHIDKQIYWNRRGISVFFIWQDEWHDSNDWCKRYILAQLTNDYGFLRDNCSIDMGGGRVRVDGDKSDGREWEEVGYRLVERLSPEKVTRNVRQKKQVHSYDCWNTGDLIYEKVES